jgi:hypothetical protein
VFKGSKILLRYLIKDYPEFYFPGKEKLEDDFQDYYIETGKFKLLKDKSFENFYKIYMDPSKDLKDRHRGTPDIPDIKKVFIDFKYTEEQLVSIVKKYPFLIFDMIDQTESMYIVLSETLKERGISFKDYIHLFHDQDLAKKYVI